jgi:hypothetical protein
MDTGVPLSHLVRRMAMQEICGYEQHFNNLQVKLRALASTWILAGFAAIAVLLKTEGKVKNPRNCLSEN